jgi:creatinine amidohydrolase
MNWEDLKLLLDLMQPRTKVRLFGLPDWKANNPGFDNDGTSGGDHAGKVETSLLWALDPECVAVSRLPPGGEDADVPPFAMGPDAALSDRLVGQRMVEDEVRWLSAKARALLNSYDETVPAPGFPTIQDIEILRDEDVRP